MGYIQIILSACLVFPFLAFLITLPYIIYNYNKYGSVLFIRTLLIYGFILYLLSAYFLVILPLPKIENVINLNLGVQLTPFNFVTEIVRYSNFNITNPSTYLPFLKEPWVYQAIYNTLLTMPFAIFLRYYFNCKLRHTLFFTFLLSLFFEITQLTGLYFIYPNAYRLFDVDDLIVNTFGGFLGYIIAPLFIKLLPNKEELDQKSYIKGSKVSTTRRIITFLIDIVFTLILFLGLFLLDKLFMFNLSFYIYLIISSFITFILISLFSGGKTIGGMITNISVAKVDSSKAKWYQILFRNILFTYIMLPIFYYLKLVLNYINVIGSEKYNIIVTVAYFFFLFFIILFIIIRNFILHQPFIYEKITKTKMISTIKDLEFDLNCNDD